MKNEVWKAMGILPRAQRKNLLPRKMPALCPYLQAELAGENPDMPTISERAIGGGFAYILAQTKC